MGFGAESLLMDDGKTVLKCYNWQLCD